MIKVSNNDISVSYVKHTKDNLLPLLLYTKNISRVRVLVFSFRLNSYGKSKKFLSNWLIQ